MKLNDITYKIRGAVFSVYNALGPGLLENIHSAALAREFELCGLRFEREKPLNVVYKGTDLGVGYKLDFVVEDKVVLELKSVQSIVDIHVKQLHTYLKITGKPIGLLINFNSTDLKNGIKRIVNGNINEEQ